MGHSELPKHVAKYLEKLDVNPDDLPEEVMTTLAGLTTGELAILQQVGDTLRANVDDISVIARVH